MFTQYTFDRIHVDKHRVTGQLSLPSGGLGKHPRKRGFFLARIPFGQFTFVYTLEGKSSEIGKNLERIRGSSWGKLEIILQTSEHVSGSGSQRVKSGFVWFALVRLRFNLVKSG